MWHSISPFTVARVHRMYLLDSFFSTPRLHLTKLKFYCYGHTAQQTPSNAQRRTSGKFVDIFREEMDLGMLFSEKNRFFCETSRVQHMGQQLFKYCLLEACAKNIGVVNHHILSLIVIHFAMKANPPEN